MSLVRLLVLLLLPWSKGLWVYSIAAGGSLELALERVAAEALTPLAGTAVLAVFAAGGGSVVTFPVPLLSLSLSVVFLKPWLVRPNRLPKLLPHPCDCGSGGCCCCCCCCSNNGWGCGCDGCSTRRSLPPAPISESQLVGKCPIRSVRLNH